MSVPADFTIQGFSSHAPRADAHAALRQLPARNAALVRRLLKGAWRDTVAPATLTEAEMVSAAPLLIHSGAAALGWRRIARSAVAGSEAAAELRAVARRLVFGDVLRADSLRQIATILNRVGIEPLVIKGWAASRYYAEPHLRPYGDFDLLVGTAAHDMARDTLAAHAVRPPRGGAILVDCEPRNRTHAVDLHATLAPFYRLPDDLLFADARTVVLPGGARVRVPSPEHHLRLVTLHFLKHGGCRPLWLCDVAAMVEQAGAAFDWEACLSDDPVTRMWVAAGIGAAHRLLDARIDHLPHSAWHEPPGWCLAAILREWRAPYALRYQPARGVALREPRAWLAAHWPNPLAATFARGRPIEAAAPLAHQWRHFLGTHVAEGLRHGLSPRWWRNAA